MEESLKILFVTPEPPTPIGGGQRMYYLLKYLSRLNIKIDLLTLVNEENVANLAMTDGFCQSKFWVKASPKRFDKYKNIIFLKAYQYYPEFKGKLAEILASQHYDLIHVQKFQMAEYFVDLKHIPIVIDLWATSLKGAWYDIIYAKNLAAKLNRCLRLIKYAIADWRYYRAFHCFTTVSPEAQDYILKKYPDKKTAVIPNGMEALDASNDQAGEENSIIYTGDMSFAPNIDAVQYFVRDIYPHIKKENPAVKFYIVGINPGQDVLQLAQRDPSIIVTGYVEDIREYLRKAKVYVVPLRSGSGIRNKVLEAMSCKKAVVSTSMALEGIMARHGEELFVADEPRIFAQEVVNLLRDQDVQNKLGKKAYHLVKTAYSWKSISADMKKYYREVICTTNS